MLLLDYIEVIALICAARYLLLAIYILIVSLLGLIFSLFRFGHPNNCFHVGNFLGKGGLFLMGAKYDFQNRQILESVSEKVIISNHQSNYDIFICALLAPERTVSIGKKSIIYFPFFGLLYWATGNILIDRANRKSAWSTMGKVEEAITSKQTSVWIMPEGTRHKKPALLRFKKGAFITAIKTKAPIIIVAINSYGQNLDLNKWRSCQIKANVLPPIDTTGYSLDNIQELMDKCFTMMEAEIKKLDA